MTYARYFLSEYLHYLPTTNTTCPTLSVTVTRRFYLLENSVITLSAHITVTSPLKRKTRWLFCRGEVGVTLVFNIRFDSLTNPVFFLSLYLFLLFVCLFVLIIKNKNKNLFIPHREIKDKSNSDKYVC